ncbi:hypothetical protein SASPL_120846 [Salvia splendens]|uniref:Uncharacterized protein n=1 Tax=Salvia splendens TaxID=180675 RepID=A0A8X8XTS2_SALSN|nr:hypothetical protein SASPL_120846 [Salvia splendens]
MVLTFEYLKSCSEGGRLVRVKCLRLSSNHFRAYKSKFGQFIMFYACSLDPDNCGKMFGNALIDIYVSGLNPVWSLWAMDLSVLQKECCCIACKLCGSSQIYPHLICYRNAGKLLVIPRLKSQLLLDDILKHHLRPLQLQLHPAKLCVLVNGENEDAEVMNIPDGRRSHGEGDSDGEEIDSSLDKMWITQQVTNSGAECRDLRRCQQVRSHFETLIGI